MSKNKKGGFWHKSRMADPALNEYVTDAVLEQAQTMTTADREEYIRNARATRQRQQEREDQELRSAMDEMMSVAERATGLTRQQLLAKHAEFSRQMPAPRVDLRTSRDTVIARGVPGVHVISVYDRSPESCQALDKVKAFLDAEQQVFLVLSGTTGTRKSGSAAWALVNHPGRFVTASALSQAALGQEDDSTEKMRLIRNAPLLVLDDIGHQYVDDKGWFVNVFNALIDERYSAMRKTIITTNLDGKEFKALYQARIADRIREFGAWEPIKGASARRKWANGGEE